MLAALAAAPLLVAGSSVPRVAAVLNVRTDQGYRLLERYDVPASHALHDGLIAFEGPGWESDRVAYRLYLDERNAIDIFGKRQPEPVLARIGIGVDDYHAMADWGMDIFKVGESLGAGGIGTLRAGRAEQIGASRISAAVVANGPQMAAIRVENRGWRGASGPVDLTTTYRIEAGSRLTHVAASASDSDTPIVAGLTHHAGVEVLRSADKGAWRYVATYGQQSLAGDALGIALFYRATDVSTTGDDGRTLYVRFADPRAIRYAFGAAWAQEPGAPTDLAMFRDWLGQTAAALDAAEPG